MIGFAPFDLEPTVELFQEDDPHQLMGKRKLGKADPFFGKVQDLLGKTDGSADDKDDMTDAVQRQIAEPPGHTFGVPRHALDGQGADIGSFRDLRQDPVRLLVQQLRGLSLGHVLLGLLIGYFDDIQSTICRKTLGIFRHSVFIKLFFDASAGDQGDLHTARSRWWMGIG